MNARTPFTEADDLMAAELAGDLSHVVTLTAFSTIEIADWIGTRVGGYRQSSFGDRFQYRFRLTGLTPGEARRLTDRLAALPEVAGIHVEHMISRSC